MFIVMKERADGTLVAGSPPKVHTSENSAVVEAERLAGIAENEAEFLVFKAISRSRRMSRPIETVRI